MIKAICLRNFQSWDKLDMELAPITMIVGRGNTGKSAIVRAITYALTNQGGDAFIRDGAPSATVALELAGGPLIWRKPRGKGATYTLDGREYTKTGQSVPEDVAALGFRGIEIDKSLVLWPQLQGQFDGPFVIGESGSRVARILGQFTRLDVLVQAQLMARRDAEGHTKQSKTAQDHATQLQVQLDALPDTEALRASYDRLTTRSESIITAQRDAEAAESALQAYRRASAARDPGDLAARAAGVQEQYAAIADVEAALQAYRRDAGVALDRSVEAVAQLRAEQDAACRTLGLCEGCPYAD